MKFSTIGTSWITESFIQAAEASGRAQFLSVYSRSGDRAKEFASKNGAVRWFDKMDEMLEDCSDFVYIASPNSMHAEQILRCLDKGKHVFCEKPMVATEEEWHAVKEAADRNNLFVMEGYRHLFSPNYQNLKKHLARAGKVRSAVLQYVQYSSKYDAFKEGRNPNVFSPEFAGGALMDLGVYPLSMAIDLFGEPKKVDYFPVALANGIDGSGTLVLTYEDSSITILCSKIAQATIPSEIHGEDGTWTMNHLAPIGSLTFYDRKSKKIEETAVAQSDNDMLYEAEIFVKMIENNDRVLYEALMERSRLTVESLERARSQAGLSFSV
ncbi:Gfo/Idh/MocA family protein [Virgibacillus xinjiangensis]|uniref:Gfo/Idh/MocA family protein n=1 Tax=Virgibacillus xinjiangensis TaxID=393090 RepID=A0ABV7CSD6_9BACI